MNLLKLNYYFYSFYKLVNIISFYQQVLFILPGDSLSRYVLYQLYNKQMYSFIQYSGIQFVLYTDFANLQFLKSQWHLFLLVECLIIHIIFYPYLFNLEVREVLQLFNALFFTIIIFRIFSNLFYTNRHLLALLVNIEMP